jgi:hypothetical protein
LIPEPVWTFRKRAKSFAIGDFDPLLTQPVA